MLNLVNRIGELSTHTQIRLAANQTKMADVADITLGPDGSWIDPTGAHRNQHWIAAPLTGAIFDILVEVYQDTLVVEGLIPDEANAQGWTQDEVAAAFSAVQSSFSRALARFDTAFVEVIRHARDTVGHAIAHVMLTLQPEGLTFDEVAARFLESMLAQGYGPILPAMLDHFLWRGIDPRPFLRFGPVALPGRGRRRAELFAVQPAPRRAHCAFCHPRGTLHVANLIRAGHVVHARGEIEHSLYAGLFQAAVGAANVKYLGNGGDRNVRNDMRENLFAGTTVLLFGRRFEGLALVNENNQAMTGCDAELKDNTPLNSPPILRALQAHLKARGATAGDAKPGLARIYGFSYLGNYYKMAEPTVLLVYGDGTKVPASTAPVPMNDSASSSRSRAFPRTCGCGRWTRRTTPSASTSPPAGCRTSCSMRRFRRTPMSPARRCPTAVGRARPPGAAGWSGAA